MTGSGAAGVSGQCGAAGRSLALTVSNTIVWGFTRGFATGPGVTLAATYSDFPGASGEGNADVDPRFEGPGDVRLRADSPLVDAGRPGALGESEPHEDALGYVRVVDGGTDGTPRRDVGALERQPPPPAAAPGNVLSNPGRRPAPGRGRHVEPGAAGWMRSGAFTFVRYGTVAGLFPFPTRRVSEALGAGDAFFAPGRATATAPCRSSTCGRRRPRSTSGWARRRCPRCSAATAAAPTARSSRRCSARPAAARSAARGSAR